MSKRPFFNSSRKLRQPSSGDVRKHREFLKKRGCGNTLTDKELQINLAALNREISSWEVQRIFAEEAVNKN